MAALGFGAAVLASSAQAIPILVFGQNGLTSPVTGVAGTGSTRITVNAAPITITGIIAGSTPIAATLNLDVTSIDAAVVAGGDLTQHFQGTFSITGGGNNYLSGAFIDLVAGAFGGNALTLSASTPPVDHVSFTSSIIPITSLGLDRALSFAFTGVSPAVNICGTRTGDLVQLHGRSGGEHVRQCQSGAHTRACIAGLVGHRPGHDRCRTPAGWSRLNRDEPMQNPAADEATGFFIVCLRAMCAWRHPRCPEASRRISDPEPGSTD